MSGSSLSNAVRSRIHAARTGHVIWLPSFQTNVTSITRWLIYGNNTNKNSKYFFVYIRFRNTGYYRNWDKTVQNCGQNWLAHNTVIITSPKLHALVTAKSITSAKREDRLLRKLKFCQLHGITLPPTPPPYSWLKLKSLHAIYPYRLRRQHAIPWPSVLKKGGQQDPNQLP